MRKFMRTRAPSPPSAHPHPPPAPSHNGQHPLHTNGHAKGAGAGAALDEPHSTLSRSRSQWSGHLYEDDEFPATWRALGDRRLARSLRWCRPHEVCARPRFRGDEGDQLAAAASGTDVDGVSDVDGDSISHADVDPALHRWSEFVYESGYLPGSAVCAAAAVLALTPRLLDRAVPPRQHTWPHHRYTGQYTFRFWVWGTWREVVIDDRLPLRRYAHGAAHDFTLPLLHKAYAKLYGGYARLRGAGLARGLQELSGGVLQSVVLAQQPRALALQLLQAAVPRATLLVCSARARAAPPCVVSGLARVRGTPLVRVRAVGGAWWGDSAEWRALSGSERAAREDEAWLSLEEWVCSFSRLELVHVAPDDWLLEPALSSRRPWRAVLARRRWRTGYNAGGPPTCTETTGTNPQFYVHIPASEGSKCHVVVSVMQQYNVGAGAGARLHGVGFALYAVGAGWGGAGASVAQLAALDVTHEARAREVVTLFTLAPGRYLLVPHTSRPHTDAAFLLRVLTDAPADVSERNHDNALVRDMPAELAQDPAAVPPRLRAAVERAATGELDARALRSCARRGRAAGRGAGWLEVCVSLVSLRDARLAGCVAAREVPALLALLVYWRGVYRRHGAAAARCGRVSSYSTRALLWAAGVTVSNKVLEAVVCRFARGTHLTLEGFVLSLARIHLAHERYRNLDANTKSNPLSLEEMILMTIYS